MTKYSFVVLNSELEQFLTSLQEFGVVDITRAIRPIDNSSREMMDKSRRFKNALKALNNFKKEFQDVQPLMEEIQEQNILERTEELIRQRNELVAINSQRERDLKDATSWGDFNSDDLLKIKALGLDIHFYITPEKKFNPQWGDSYPLQILNNAGGKVYFAIVVPKGEEYKFQLMEAKFPETSISSLQSSIKETYSQIEEIERRMAGLPSHLEALQNQSSLLLEELDLYFANASTVKEGEETIAVLEGFAPVEEESSICKFLDNSDAFYIKEEAVAEDNPPVKLKNNFFAKLFEPIGDFYMLPKYDELDLTPFYAPFYMLFFGFCLGDMGYGLILLIVGLIATFFLPSFKKYGKLVICLGIGTIIMPALTGGFFGTKIYDIIDLPESVDNFFFSDMKLFWFGIIFGIFQIVFARVIHAIDCFTRKNWNGGLSALGWSILIVILTFMYAGSEMNKDFFPPIVNNIMLYGGIGLILFFSKPSKSIFMRPLMGITSLYDITGVFGDILSYIRLFGLATSGGILGMVVNSVAMQMTGIPYVGWGFAVLMLVIGHIAVLALSALGAFVHPMRLTFVEFYKNAEFTGGGRAFNPLSKISKSNK